MAHFSFDWPISLQIQTMLIIALLGVLAVPMVAAEEKETPTHDNYKFEVGDPRLCMTVANERTKQRFQVLPGIGWDNLQNVAKAQVIDYSFSKCQTTDDERYLVPDQVFTIPIKSSFVETHAEYMDSWRGNRDLTSNSVNVNAGLSYGAWSVSGSFSYENTKIKKMQIEENSASTRVQLRYHRYKAQLQPDSQLHRSFKQRLLNIAAFLENNQTLMAGYEGQLIVRDFGTHHLSSVTAGAGLIKTDFLKRDFVNTQKSSKTKMLASASVSYSVLFGLSASISTSYGRTTEDDEYKKYQNSLTNSYVTSYGGPIMKAFNMSANDWTSGVDMEMVPMDRSGDPLSFLVTRATLPELPLEMVDKVEKILRRSIIQYYEKNTISGCTTLGAPNFIASANFDDGSCDAQANNMTFGGVYQTCRVEGKYFYNNPCTGMTQVNPKTSTFSCPEPYTDITLMTGRSVGQAEYRRKSYRCGWGSRCYATVRYVATAAYEAHWCAGLDVLSKDSGYLYGGHYTATEQNPLTNAMDCPAFFTPQLFLDHHICISDDFAQGRKFSKPFGGFMSCHTGNPLSTLGDKFTKKANGPPWPNHCPRGYSQHLQTIKNGCEIRYCLKSGSLKGPDVPQIKLPPFEEKPNLEVPSTERYNYNAEKMVWVKRRGDSDSDSYSYSASDASTWHSDVALLAGCVLFAVTSSRVALGNKGH